MNYFIFNYETHQFSIDSFLESASVSHKIPQKTKEWFLWKFRDNPYGEAILACAEEDGKIVGCVAYGMQDFLLDGKVIKGALSFETFVHPEYQGKGVFSKLIKLGEEVALKKDVAFLVNFPNSNSLRGFLKSGWGQIDKPEYHIKLRANLSVIRSISDIKKGFLPNPSNLKSLAFIQKAFKQRKCNLLQSEIRADYLNWRFFSYPISEYAVVEYADVYSIVRLGKRGKLREGQVLFVNYGEKLNMGKFIKACKKSFDFDILSFSISQSNPLSDSLKKNLFFKVPNSTNICFNILDESKITADEVRSLSLSAINYHTY